jgi:glycosyltransferase involved in cell wall biosynthesis
VKVKVASLVLNNFTHDNRVLKECVTLQNNGYDVTVLAYHEPGLEEHEEMMGIKIHRIKLTSKEWSRNRILQIFKFLEFMYRIIREHQHHDIYHCNDLNALPIGYVIKRFFQKRAKIVYDAHEYETERNGLSKLDRRFSQFLERRLISNANSVITVSQGIAEEYQRLYGVKAEVIMNCPIYSEVPSSNVLREKLGIADGAKIFIYLGAIVNGRGVEGTLEAFKSIEDPNMVIVFLGYGTLVDMVKDAASKHDNIYFHEAVSMLELMKYTAGADYGLSLIENICLSYYYSLPNKFFEYIMAGVPVIATNLHEMKKIIEEDGVGHITESNSSDSILNAVNEMAKKDKGAFQTALAVAAKRYSWEQQESRLLNLYANLGVS